MWTVSSNAPRTNGPWRAREWTRAYLDAEAAELRCQPPSKRRHADRFDGMKGKASFSTAPFAKDPEITGPVAATLFVSTTAQATPTCSLPCGRSRRPTRSISSSRAVGSSMLRSRRLAARFASQARSRRSEPYRRSTSHDETPIPRTRRDLRAGGRNLANVLRLSEGISTGPDRRHSDFEHDLPGPYPKSTARLCGALPCFCTTTPRIGRRNASAAR